MTSDQPIFAPSTGSETDADPGSALLVQGDPQGSDASLAIRHLSEDSPMAGLPMQLDVNIPVPDFRVKDLLALEKGTVLETHWSHTEDVPVWCGGVQLLWAESIGSPGAATWTGHDRARCEVYRFQVG